MPQTISFNLFNPETHDGVRITVTPGTAPEEWIAAFEKAPSVNDIVMGERDQVAQPMPETKKKKGCCGRAEAQKWLFVWWYGLPYPLRIWRWMTLPTHPKPSSWKGCGCLLYFKALYDSHRRIRDYLKAKDDGAYSRPTDPRPDQPRGDHQVDPSHGV